MDSIATLEVIARRRSDALGRLEFRPEPPPLANDPAHAIGFSTASVIAFACKWR
jgi:hypothetical protein